MSSTASENAPIRAHRRAVWIKIIAPVAVPFLVLIALCVTLAVGTAAGQIEARQITIIMGILATAFIALPLVILCVVPYIMLALLASLSGLGYAHAKKPIRFLRHASERVAETTARTAPRVVRPLVSMNVRITRWEETIRGWQALPDGKKEQNDE